MTKIVYEDKGDGKGVLVELCGTETDLVKAMIRLLDQMHEHCGLDVLAFAATLPMFAALAHGDIEKSIIYDLSKKKNSHE